MKKSLFFGLLLSAIGFSIQSEFSIQQIYNNGKFSLIINGVEYPCAGNCKVVIINDTIYVDGKPMFNLKPKNSNDNSSADTDNTGRIEILPSIQVKSFESNPNRYLKIAATSPIGWTVFSKLHKNAQANKFPFKNINVSPSWIKILRGAKMGFGAVTAMEIGALTVYTFHNVYLKNK